MGLIFTLSEYFQYKLNNRQPKQMTFIYCDCGNDLCSDGSFISDSYDENKDNHVLYKCKKCGKEHDYNFDIAPAPVNWKKIKG